MKTTSQVQRIGCCVLGAALAASVLPLAGAAKTNAPVAAPAGVELQPVAIPQSEFAIPKSPREGRDPFFPDSPRLFGSATARTNAVPTAATCLLKGLAGQAGARFATISLAGAAGASQSVDLAVGEEREIVTASGRVKVRCVEIKEDSVVIEAGGIRRELYMRAVR